MLNFDNMFKRKVKPMEFSTFLKENEKEQRFNEDRVCSNNIIQKKCKEKLSITFTNDEPDQIFLDLLEICYELFHKMNFMGSVRIFECVEHIKTLLGPIPSNSKIGGCLPKEITTIFNFFRLVVVVLKLLYPKFNLDNVFNPISKLKTCLNGEKCTKECINNLGKNFTLNSVLKYAELSQWIYDNKQEKEMGGVLHFFSYPESSNSNNGFFAQVYYMEQGNVIIVHRGTVPTNGNNILNDLQLFLGVGLNYESDIVNLFKEMEKFAETKKITIRSIETTGHSLGAVLSQLFCSFCAKNGYKSKSITFENPGIKGYESESEVFGECGIDDYFRNDENLKDNFVINHESNLINSLNEQFGNLYTLHESSTHFIEYLVISIKRLLKSRHSNQPALVETIPDIFATTNT